MREDIPSRDLQDLHPIPGDGRVPFGWLRSIDRACTEWLLKRDLLGSPAEHRVELGGAPKDEDAEEKTGGEEALS
jgi:hypothetical protein